MDQCEVHARCLLDGIGHRVQAAVSGGAALDHPAAAAQSQVGGDGPVLVLCVVGGSDIQRGRVVDVVVLKHLQHLLDGEFPVVVVADR